MMPIVFRRGAEADLQAIIDWYRDVAPQAVDLVLADIYRSIDQLSRYPRSGMAVPAGNSAASSPCDIISRWLIGSNRS